MKILVRTLKGSHFEVEIKPEDTVAGVKKTIETAQGVDAYPAIQQVLIHKGKIMKDDTTLEENDVADSSFVVIMLKKASQASEPPPAAGPVSAPPRPPFAASLPIPAPASNPVLPTSTVDTVVRALRAGYNNPERAVEYLYSRLLQEVEMQNPQLFRLMQDHQTDFLRLFNEPSEGGEGNLQGQPAGAITVTPEEREAIERLVAMGFNRALVLEVFFACNKNDELAANYLLDHIHEFED